MKTLLEQFFEDKCNHHSEPIRVKVPRGKKIGMSKAKYQAALASSLCNFDLKGLAGQLQGSYEVIRRWKTERDFKNVVKETLDEFIWNLDIELESIAAEMIDQTNAGNFSYDFKERFEIFKDADIYSKPVIEHIESKVDRYISMPNGHIVFFEMAYFLAKHSGNCPRLNRLFIQAKESLRASIIDRAIEVINNPESPEAERKEVVGLLQKVKS